MQLACFRSVLIASNTVTSVNDFHEAIDSTATVVIYVVKW